MLKSIAIFACHPTLGFLRPVAPVLLALSLLGGCATNAPRASVDAAPSSAAHENLNAVLWFQRSTEYRAIALATYAHASQALAVALRDPNVAAALEQANPPPGLRPAVVVDVDETILDNSAYQARLVREGGVYEDASWAAWCEERRATAVPGALDFAHAAALSGVEIFYVTNRDVSVSQATIDNLRALGFPNADSAHFYPRDKARGWADKGPRRAEIARSHRILLLIGDNLGDFSDDYRGSPEQREALAQEHRDWWGERWFMLPNPMYGSWEQSLLNYDYSSPPEQQLQRKREALQLGH